MKLFGIEMFKSQEPVQVAFEASDEMRALGFSGTYAIDAESFGAVREVAEMVSFLPADDGSRILEDALICAQQGLGTETIVSRAQFETEMMAAVLY